MAKDLWQYNHIQFPRLLSEIIGVGLSEEQWDDILENMDLESDELSELFDRAQSEWESIKNRYCPLSPKIVLDLSTECDSMH